MEPLIYRNAIEPLVALEVERQLQNLQPGVIAYINPAQVIAYALNRLPTLYATSEEGWNKQQQKVKTQLAQQIEVAVKWGLNVVLQDPFKPSTPLSLHDKTADQVEGRILRDRRPNFRINL
jgi:Late competence development protein ComFB